MTVAAPHVAAEDSRRRVSVGSVDATSSLRGQRVDIASLRHASEILPTPFASFLIDCFARYI